MAFKDQKQRLKPSEIQGRAAKRGGSKLKIKTVNGVETINGLKVKTVNGVRIVEVNGNVQGQAWFAHPAIPDGTNEVIRMDTVGEGNTPSSK